MVARHPIIMAYYDFRAPIGVYLLGNVEVMSAHLH